MAAAFFPSLCYGEAGLEDLLQLCGDEHADQWLPLPDEVMAHADIDDARLTDESTPSTDDSLRVPLINPGAQTPDQLLTDDGADLWTTSIRYHSAQTSPGRSTTWPHAAIDAPICQVDTPGYQNISEAFPSSLMSKSAYPVLDAGLRDDLVKVYFNNIHPFCPIIDEQNFWWHYVTLNEKEFFAMFPPMLFNAMMFAAFAHATDEQVILAGFSSTSEVQMCYVRALTEMYDYAYCEVWSAIEELVLAKTALLLSLWCPPKGELTICSLWVDRAIHHTKQYLHKNSPDTDDLMPKRINILYWCCIARNTCISFVMRRPYRLFLEDQPLCDPEDVRGEFDREILFHNFSSPGAKLRMIEDFVRLCKLSQRLSSILRSQRSALFELQWNVGQNTIEETDETYTGDELHKYLSIYLAAAETESDLLGLIESHDRTNHEGSTTNMADNSSCEDPSEEMLAKLRLYTLTIMTYSSIAALYQFTLSTTTRFWPRSCHRTALTKLKDASTKASLTVERLLAEVSVYAIPGAILAWTISPMMTFLVEGTCSRYGLPQLSDDEDFDMQDIESRSRQAGSLLALTKLLAPRFQTARDVVSLLQDLDRLLSCDAAVRRGSTKLPVSTSEAAVKVRKLQQLSLGWEEDRQAVDLDLLNHASRFLDTRIAYGIA